MAREKTDWDNLDIVRVNTYEHESVLFQWGVNKIGFGEITFYYKDGKLYCDNEYMSKDFIKKILCDFVDRAELTEWDDEREAKEKERKAKKDED